MLKLWQIPVFNEIDATLSYICQIINILISQVLADHRGEVCYSTQCLGGDRDVLRYDVELVDLGRRRRCQVGKKSGEVNDIVNRDVGALFQLVQLLQRNILQFRNLDGLQPRSVLRIL